MDREDQIRQDHQAQQLRKAEMPTLRERFIGGDPRFYDSLEKIAGLHSRKNTDYAKDSAQGHLGNFYRSASWKKLYPGFDWTSPFGTAMDFLFKQLDAAMILYSTGRRSITGEDIAARMDDVAVYAVIAKLLQHDEDMLLGAPLVPPSTDPKPADQLNPSGLSGSSGLSAARERTNY